MTILVWVIQSTAHRSSFIKRGQVITAQVDHLSDSRVPPIDTALSGAFKCEPQLPLRDDITLKPERFSERTIAQRSPVCELGSVLRSVEHFLWSKRYVVEMSYISFSDVV